MSARVTVCQTGEAAAFRIEGRATLKNSPPVRRLAEEYLERETGRLLFDLQDCTYMDSTFVGTLLFLHRRAKDCQSVEVALASPSSECQRLLKQLRIHRLFSECDANALPHGPWCDLEQCDPKDSQCQNVVVQVHRQLADLPGEAGEPFRALADRLEAEAAAANSR